MAYPVSLDNLQTNVQDDIDAASGVDTGVSVTIGHHAANHNSANAAINAIETELGLTPKGTFASVAARLNARTTVRKTADQTFSSSITLANITDLVFPVVAGSDYFFRFILGYTSNTLTNGVRLGFTVPAVTYVAAAVTITGRAAITAGTQGAATTNLSEYTGYITASGGAVASDAVAAINTTYIAIVEGLISPSASGNLQLQAANEVSTASGNIIKKGSYGELYVN